MIEFPVFDLMPDFTDDPVIRVLAASDVLAISPAAAAIIGWPDDREEIASNYRFAFNTLENAIAYKSALQAFGGRHGAFFLPSWSRDLQLVGLPLYGAKVITVSKSSYASLLTTTYPEQEGRHIYIADQTNGVHAMRVIRAVGGVLNIEPPLPWDVTQGAVVGFLRLVRLESDDQEIEHASERHIETAQTFRTIRATIAIDRAVELANTATQYGFGPFTRSTQVLTPAPSLRYDYETAQGPEVLGSPNSLGVPFTKLWTAYLHTDGIYIRPGSLTEEQRWAVTGLGGVKSDLFDFAPITEHVSIAFDFDGNEVLAVGLPDGKFALRGWVDDMPTQHVFDGYSPRLVQRWTVTNMAHAPANEVAVIYFKPNDSGIFARFESDEFDTEVHLGGWPAPPLQILYSRGADRTFTITGIDRGHRMMTIQTVYPPPPPDPTPTPTPPATPPPTFMFTPTPIGYMTPTPPIPSPYETPPPTFGSGDYQPTPTETDPVTPPMTPTPPMSPTPPEPTPPSEDPGEEPPPSEPEPTPFDPTPPEPTPFDPTPAEPTPFDPTPWEEPTPFDPTPFDPTPEPTPFEPTPEPTPFEPTPPE